MDIQDTKEQRQAFDEWHYNQYLLENPNIDISNAKYIYDYAHKNVLVFQLRESHFTAWQAAKAQAVPDGFVVVNKKELAKVLNCVTDNWLIDTDSVEEFKKIESLVQDEIDAMFEAQEQAND